MSSKLDSTNLSNPSPSTDEEFMQLLLQYHRRIFGYLRTLVDNNSDAEDILQNTCVALWRKRHQFRIGTSFINWAITFAQLEVRHFRRDSKRVSHVLTDELLERVAIEAASEVGSIDARFQALDQCVEKLSLRDRWLVDTIYGHSAPTKKDVSQQLGVTPNALYKVLNRIRQRLLKCIEHRLTTEGGT
jgi:RNA polymerase sigma-70 factor, ECF subfamily